MEPWKTIICQSVQCLKESIDEEGKVKEEYRILPNADGARVTQFTCPRCGLVETWGVDRRLAAKVLYERFANA